MGLIVSSRRKALDRYKEEVDSYSLAGLETITEEQYVLESDPELLIYNKVTLKYESCNPFTKTYIILLIPNEGDIDSARSLLLQHAGKKLKIRNHSLRYFKC